MDFQTSGLVNSDDKPRRTGKGGWDWIRGPKFPIGDQLCSPSSASAILGLSHPRCTPKQQLASFARGKNKRAGVAKSLPQCSCTSAKWVGVEQVPLAGWSLELWLWLELARVPRLPNTPGNSTCPSMLWNIDLRLLRFSSSAGSTIHRVRPQHAGLSHALGKFPASNTLRI